MDALACDLQHYLQQSRNSLLRALDDLPEYDVRRPVTPTGTNLLGLVKHLTGIEASYLGDCVGRPAPFRLPWVDDGSIWDSAATTFGHLLVRVVAETAQHAGHADITRETIDGRGGPDHGDIGNAAWWETYIGRIQAAADTFGSGK